MYDAGLLMLVFMFCKDDYFFIVKRERDQQLMQHSFNATFVSYILYGCNIALLDLLCVNWNIVPSAFIN